MFSVQFYFLERNEDFICGPEWQFLCSCLRYWANFLCAIQKKSNCGPALSHKISAMSDAFTAWTSFY